MTKEIPLTKGYTTIVDDVDYKWAKNYTWYVSITQDGNAYAKRKAKVNGRWRHIKLHREILGHPPGLVVDHINHDTLDNRRCNIRAVTQSENLMNSGPRKRNTSGYKGVTIHTGNGRWRARIWNGEGRRIHIGYFDTAEEAARAYDQAAISRGITIGLNFPV